MGRHQQFLKFVATAVIMCLLAQDAAVALPSQTTDYRPQTTDSAETPGVEGSHLRELGWLSTKNLGTIDEEFQGTNGKSITFILDAHDSLDAQKNIVRIIQRATASGRVRTVFEEGYEDELNTDEWFGDIQDDQIRRKVAYYYLDQLKIGAAEFAHINRQSRLGQRTKDKKQSTDWQLVGADDKQAYLENVRAFGDSEKVRAKILRDTQAIQRELKAVGAKQLTPEAQKWIADYQRFHEHALPLLDYLNRWLKFIPQEACPLLRRILSAAQDLELARSIQRIRAAEVLIEIKQFESSLEAHFFEERQTAEIWQAQKTMGSVEKLTNLKISSHELDELKQNLKMWDTESLAPLLARAKKNPVVLSKRWETLIQDALKFYELAHKRDMAVERALLSWNNSSAPLRASEQEPKDKEAVLVFGGFHREGITEILRRNGFSYTVVIPKITDFSKRHQLLYREAMSVGPRGSGHGARQMVQAARPLSGFYDHGFRYEIPLVAALAKENPKLDQRSFALLVERTLLEKSSTTVARGVNGENLSRPSASPNTRRLLFSARSESRKKAEKVLDYEEIDFGTKNRFLKKALSTYLTPKVFETGGFIYKWFGIQYFIFLLNQFDRQKILPRLPVSLSTPLTDSKPEEEISVSGRIKMGSALEIMHLAAFFIILALASMEHLSADNFGATLLHLGNVIANVYPIFVQRYVRARLWPRYIQIKENETNRSEARAGTAKKETVIRSPEVLRLALGKFNILNSGALHELFSSQQTSLQKLTKAERDLLRRIALIRDSTKKVMRKEKGENEFHGPFAPANVSQVMTVLKHLGAKQGEKIMDLGHGEGSVLFGAAALFGLQGLGGELNSYLYRKSAAIQAELVDAGILDAGAVELRKENFNQLDLRTADYVFFFSFGGKVDQEKLLRELKPGAKFILLGLKNTNWEQEELTGYSDFSKLLENGQFELVRFPELRTWVFTKLSARSEMREATRAQILEILRNFEQFRENIKVSEPVVWDLEGVELNRARPLLVLPDIHGDLEGMLAMLYFSGVIDREGLPTGSADVIQLGDVINGREQWFEADDYLRFLQQEFEERGLSLIRLAGNHDVKVLKAFDRKKYFLEWVYGPSERQLSGLREFFQQYLWKNPGKQGRQLLRKKFTSVGLPLHIYFILEKARDFYQAVKNDIQTGKIKAAARFGNLFVTHAGLSPAAMEEESLGADFDEKADVLNRAFQAWLLKESKPKQDERTADDETVDERIKIILKKALGMKTAEGFKKSSVWQLTGHRPKRHKRVSSDERMISADFDLARRFEVSEDDPVYPRILFLKENQLIEQEIKLPRFESPPSPADDGETLKEEFVARFSTEELKEFEIKPVSRIRLINLIQAAISQSGVLESASIQNDSVFVRVIETAAHGESSITLPAQNYHIGGYHSTLAEAYLQQNYLAGDEFLNTVHAIEVWRRSEARYLEAEKIYFDSPEFLSATHYFNEAVIVRDEAGTIQPMDWNKLITIYERLRGDDVNAEYTDEDRQLRLSHENEPWAREWLQNINRQDLTGDEALNLGVKIYRDSSEGDGRNQMFVKKAGFDRVRPPKKAGAYFERHPADGHHGLAWFLMNFFLMRNGYAPFYFKNEKEYLKIPIDYYNRDEGAARLRQLLRERVFSENKGNRSEARTSDEIGLQQIKNTEIALTPRAFHGRNWLRYPWMTTRKKVWEVFGLPDPRDAKPAQQKTSRDITFIKRKSDRHPVWVILEKDKVRFEEKFARELLMLRGKARSESRNDPKKQAAEFSKKANAIIKARGNLEEAARLAEEAIELDYTNAFAHVALIQARRGLGQYKDALEAFISAERDIPDNQYVRAMFPSILNSFAAQSADQNQLDDAIDTFRKIFPDTPEELQESVKLTAMRAREALAYQAIERGDFGKALQIAEQINQILPSNQTTDLILATAFIHQGQPGRAEAQLDFSRRKFLARNPRSYLIKALSAAHKLRPNEAKAILNEAQDVFSAEKSIVGVIQKHSKLIEAGADVGELLNQVNRDPVLAAREERIIAGVSRSESRRRSQDEGEKILKLHTLYMDVMRRKANAWKDGAEKVESAGFLVTDVGYYPIDTDNEFEHLLAIFPKIRDKTNFNQPLRFLDLGSGAGKLLIQVLMLDAHLNGVGIEYDQALYEVSLDLAEEAAKQKLISRERAHFLKGDFSVPEFEKEISSADVLFHYQASSFDPALLEQALIRSMRPGAKLLVYGSSRDYFPKLSARAGFERAFDETARVTTYKRNFMPREPISYQDTAVVFVHTAGMGDHSLPLALDNRRVIKDAVKAMQNLGGKELEFYIDGHPSYLPPRPDRIRSRQENTAALTSPFSYDFDPVRNLRRFVMAGGECEACFQAALTSLLEESSGQAAPKEIHLAADAVYQVVPVPDEDDLRGVLHESKAVSSEQVFDMAAKTLVRNRFTSIGKISRAENFLTQGTFSESSQVVVWDNYREMIDWIRADQKRSEARANFKAVWKSATTADGQMRMALGLLRRVEQSRKTRGLDLPDKLIEILKNADEIGVGPHAQLNNTIALLRILGIHVAFKLIPGLGTVGAAGLGMMALSGPWFFAGLSLFMLQGFLRAATTAWFLTGTQLPAKTGLAFLSAVPALGILAVPVYMLALKDQRGLGFAILDYFWNSAWDKLLFPSLMALGAGLFWVLRWGVNLGVFALITAASVIFFTGSKYMEWRDQGRTVLQKTVEAVSVIGALAGFGATIFYFGFFSLATLFVFTAMAVLFKGLQIFFDFREQLFRKSLREPGSPAAAEKKEGDFKNRSEERSALEIFDEAADNLLAYPKALLHSRGLEPYLDAFDREHYAWDETHQHWASKDFHPTITGAKRLILGSWEDIRRASPGEHARMKNFVAIRLNTTEGARSFYAFDDHGWSLQAYAEAHWRGEIPALGNTQIFIDKHGDDRKVRDGQYYAERFTAMLRQDAGTNNNIEFDMGGFNNTLWSSGFIPKENHHRYHARMSWLKEMMIGFPNNRAVLLNVDTDVTEFIVGDWGNEMPLGLGEEDFESLAVDLTNLRDQYGLTPLTAHFTTTHFENENLADFSLHSNRIQYGDTELARFLARIAPFIYFVKDQPVELRDQAIAQAAQEHAAQWKQDFGAKFNRSEMRAEIIFPDAQKVKDVFEKAEGSAVLSEEDLETAVQQAVAESRAWLADRVKQETPESERRAIALQAAEEKIDERTLYLEPEHCGQQCGFSSGDVRDRLYSLLGAKVKIRRIQAKDGFGVAQSQKHLLTLISLPDKSKIFLIDLTFAQFMDRKNSPSPYIGMQLKSNAPDQLNTLLRRGYVDLTENKDFLTQYAQSFLSEAEDDDAHYPLEHFPAEYIADHTDLISQPMSDFINIPAAAEENFKKSLEERGTKFLILAKERRERIWREFLSFYRNRAGQQSNLKTGDGRFFEFNARSEMRNDEAGNPFFVMVHGEARYWQKLESEGYFSEEDRSLIFDAVDGLIRPDASILDLMSGRKISFSKKQRNITALGLTEAILRQNKIDGKIDNFDVQDLNRNSQLPYADKAFDSVVISFGIMYLTQPAEVLKEVRRILKPGGNLIVIYAEDSWASSSAVALWNQPGLFRYRGSRIYGPPFLLDDHQEFSQFYGQSDVLNFYLRGAGFEITERKRVFGKKDTRVVGSEMFAEMETQNIYQIVSSVSSARSEARLDELLDKNRRNADEWKETIRLIKATLSLAEEVTPRMIVEAPAAKGKLRYQTLVMAVHQTGGDYASFGLDAEEKNSISEKETKIKAAARALLAEKKSPSPEAVLSYLQKPAHFFKGLDEGALKKLGLVFPEKKKTADEKYMPILEALVQAGEKFETVREIAIAAAGVPESYVKELGAPKLTAMGLLTGGTNPYEKLSQRFRVARQAKINAAQARKTPVRTIAELSESTGIPATTLAKYTAQQLEELGYIPRPVKLERAVKALLVENPGQIISYEVLAQKITEMGLEDLKPEQLREWNAYQKPPFTAQPGWRKRFEPIMKAVEVLGTNDSELDLFFKNSLGVQTVWIWQIEYFVAKAADILKQNPYFRSRWNEQTGKDFTAAVMRAHTVTEPEKAELQQISAKDAALKWLVATGGAETLKPAGPVSTIQISLEGFSENGQTLYEKYEYEKTNGLSAEMLVEQLGFSDQPGAKRRLTDIKQVLIDGIDQGRSWHKIGLSSRTSALVIRHKNYQRPQASLAESKTSLNVEKTSVPRRELKTKPSPSRATGRRDARYWTIAMLSAAQRLEADKFFDVAEKAIQAMRQEGVRKDYLTSFTRVFDKHARQMDLLSQEPEDREAYQRYQLILKLIGELQASARSETRSVPAEQYFIVGDITRADLIWSESAMGLPESDDPEKSKRLLAIRDAWNYLRPIQREIIRQRHGMSQHKSTDWKSIANRINRHKVGIIQLHTRTLEQLQSLENGAMALFQDTGIPSKHLQEAFNLFSGKPLHQLILKLEYGLDGIPREEDDTAIAKILKEKVSAELDRGQVADLRKHLLKQLKVLAVEKGWTDLEIMQKRKRKKAAPKWTEAELEKFMRERSDEGLAARGGVIDGGFEYVYNLMRARHGTWEAALRFYGRNPEAIRLRSALPNRLDEAAALQAAAISSVKAQPATALETPVVAPAIETIILMEEEYFYIQDLISRGITLAEMVRRSDGHHLRPIFAAIMGIIKVTAPIFEKYSNFENRETALKVFNDLKEIELRIQKLPSIPEPDLPRHRPVSAVPATAPQPVVSPVPLSSHDKLAQDFQNGLRTILNALESFQSRSIYNREGFDRFKEELAGFRGRFDKIKKALEEEPGLASRYAQIQTQLRLFENALREPEAKLKIAKTRFEGGAVARKPALSVPPLNRPRSSVPNIVPADRKHGHGHYARAKRLEKNEKPAQTNDWRTALIKTGKTKEALEEDLLNLEELLSQEPQDVSATEKPRIVRLAETQQAWLRILAALFLPSEKPRAELSKAAKEFELLFNQDAQITRDKHRMLMADPRYQAYDAAVSRLNDASKTRLVPAGKSVNGADLFTLSMAEIIATSFWDKHDRDIARSEMRDPQKAAEDIFNNFFLDPVSRKKLVTTHLTIRTIGEDRGLDPEDVGLWLLEWDFARALVLQQLVSNLNGIQKTSPERLESALDLDLAYSQVMELAGGPQYRQILNFFHDSEELPIDFGRKVDEAISGIKADVAEVHASQGSQELIWRLRNDANDYKRYLDYITGIVEKENFWKFDLELERLEWQQSVFFRSEARYQQILNSALKRVSPDQAAESLMEIEFELSVQEEEKLDSELKELAIYFAEQGDLEKAAVMFWLIKDDSVAASLTQETKGLENLGRQREALISSNAQHLMLSANRTASVERSALNGPKARILISREELVKMSEENFLAFYKFFYQNQELELSVYSSGPKNPEEETRVGLLEAVPSAKTGRVSFFLDLSSAAQGGEAIEFSSVPGTKTVRGKKIAAADIRTVEGMASGFLAAMGMEYTEEKGFVRVTNGVEISRFFEFLSWQVFAASA